MNPNSHSHHPSTPRNEHLAHHGSAPRPRLRLSWMAALVVICLAAPLAALGSGSYCVCIPKPPPKGAKARVDRDKYDLGQKVFNGKTAPAQSEAAAQRAQLQGLQTQLPGKVAKKKDLTALAGKLTAEQLEALSYYVNQRYPAGK